MISMRVLSTEYQCSDASAQDNHVNLYLLLLCELTTSIYANSKTEYCNMVEKLKAS